VTLALLVRILPASVHFVVGTDEALYLTLAQHLAAGHGFTADGAHPHSEFDPGYPLFAALIYRLTGTDDFTVAPPSPAEAAIRALELPARLNILLLGSLLALPIYFLARAFEQNGEGRTGIAWRAGLLTATLPALALGARNLEAASEQLYSPALWFGWLWLWLGIEKRRWNFFALSGLSFGLAHLTRWEGLLSAGVAGLLLVAAALPSRGPGTPLRPRSWLLFLGGVLLLAGPYAAYQTARTGTIFSSKAIIHQLHGEALASSDPFAWERAYANYERARDDPGLYPPLPIYLWEHRAQTALNYARNTLTQIRLIFASPTFMFVIWLPLAIIGARRLARPQSLFLAATLFPLIIFPLSVVDARYLLPLAPGALIWAAAGLARADGWLRERLSRRFNVNVPLLTAGLCAAFIAADLVGTFLIPAPTEYQALGEWMRANGVGRGEGVMARKRPVPFYAGARWEWLPFTDTAGLLDYAAERGARYVVIDERTVPTLRPQLAYLLDPAEAPDNLELVMEISEGDKKILLYRIRAGE